eukprot:gene11114-7740_t
MCVGVPFVVTIVNALYKKIIFHKAHGMNSDRLVVPLPPGYGDAKEDGYSVFAGPRSNKYSLPEPLEHYLNDLCAFLKETKLIQRHPDDYFDYIGPFPKDDCTHMDDTPISSEERKHADILCDTFGALIQDATLKKDMPKWIGCGPPPGYPALAAFYTTTKKLQLSRQRRVSEDDVLFTVGRDIGGALLPTQALNETETAKKKRILNFVLSKGMNQKKIHEVSIMAQSIADLVQCCTKTTSSDPVKTVINIGEGKGYVSRALSLAWGLQVIGLDCNPAHKEKAVGRIEGLVEASCNSSQLSGSPLNLLYEPRGHVTSIACRVGDKVDWATLFRHYVHIVDEKGTVTEAMGTSEDELSISCDPSYTTDVKMRCKCCQRILRQSIVSLTRHAYLHMDEGSEELVSQIELHQWNHTDPPEVFSRKIVERFFEVVSAPQRNCLPDTLLPFFVPRGYRARVFITSRSSFRLSETNKNCRCVPSGVEVLLTVLAFDGASQLHHVIFDGEQQRSRIALVQRRANTTEYLTEELREVLHLKHLGLVVAVESPSAVLKPVVKVPSLSNTVMIGLHTCGDLGSNICRIFANSCSRGLLLVSCCWHALTESGFPLSHAMRSRGLSVNQFSVLLATQPFDMWASADAKGHQSSAKLLFYRSLLKLLWRMWEKEWERTPSRRSCCKFAPLPHLEPGFLRGVAKCKDELTFSQFFRSVLRHYIFSATFHSTPYTWDHHVCTDCRKEQEAFFASCVEADADIQLESRLFQKYFPSFLGMTVLRMWMCHTIESLFLLDRMLFLYESAYTADSSPWRHSAVSLCPLFDGRISPRIVLWGQIRDSFVSLTLNCIFCSLFFFWIWRDNWICELQDLMPRINKFNSYSTEKFIFCRDVFVNSCMLLRKCSSLFDRFLFIFILMSKQVKVHSPYGSSKSRGQYSHSPYSLNNSPMMDTGYFDNAPSSSSPVRVPVPTKHHHSFNVDIGTHSSNNSRPASPMYDMYASYHSKGAEEPSPLVVPSNFLHSNQSPAGSPPAEHSYSPRSYHSGGGPVSNSPGADPCSPGCMYPPTSYAPASFSPPNKMPVQKSSPPYPGGLMEPFGGSPSNLTRGFLDNYAGNGPPKSTPSTSSASVSNASSVADNLPLCPDDENCVSINEKAHQRKFAHTCRLFPCYHGHINRHAKLFRHVPGQVVLPEGVSKKLSTQALTSVTFSSISQEAPNAYRIYVAHQGKKYEIFGDWENVKVHTFKRYLHQVCSIPPASQSLMAAKTSTIMDDDISSVKSCGIDADALIILSNRDEEESSLRIAFDDLLEDPIRNKCHFSAPYDLRHDINSYK